MRAGWGRGREFLSRGEPKSFHTLFSTTEADSHNNPGGEGVPTILGNSRMCENLTSYCGCGQGVRTPRPLASYTPLVHEDRQTDIHSDHNTALRNDLVDRRRKVRLPPSSRALLGTLPLRLSIGRRRTGGPSGPFVF